MGFLYAILGIIAVIVILFSCPLGVIIDYGKHTKVYIKYLFLKIPVVDTSKPEKEKKPKKDKKKKEKPAEDNGAEETSLEQLPEDSKADNKEKPQGNSLLKQLYIDEGYDGIVKMLSGVKKSLGSFFGKLYKNFVFDELYITMITAGSDAADTAIKHGKLCSYAYPVLGKLVSTCKVKKYDFNFSPDFLAKKNEASAYVRMHLIPIKLTNSVVVLAVQLVFKVLFKILFAKKKSDKSKVIISVVDKTASADDNTKINENINKDGASQ